LSIILGCLGLIKKPTADDYAKINARITDYLNKDNKKSLSSSKKKDDKKAEAKMLAYVDPLDNPEETAMVYVKKEDLTDLYLGWTEQKTLTTIGKALGRVLFIDEIYRLGSANGEKDYGEDAANTLLAEMSAFGTKMGVIGAGYKHEIEDRFYTINVGFKSRFPNKIEFKSYTPVELAKIFALTLYSTSNPMRGIFKLMATEGKTVQEELVEFFTEHIDSFATSNARGAKSLVDMTIRQFVRTSSTNNGFLDFENMKKSEVPNYPWLIYIDNVRAAFKELEPDELSDKPEARAITEDELKKLNDDIRKVVLNQYHVTWNMNQLQAFVEELRKNPNLLGPLQNAVISTEEFTSKLSKEGIDDRLSGIMDMYAKYTGLSNNIAKATGRLAPVDHYTARCHAKYIRNPHDMDNVKMDIVGYKALSSHSRGYMIVHKDVMCSFCGKESGIYTCSVCKNVYYCGSQCQSDHWRIHKRVCISIF